MPGLCRKKKLWGMEDMLLIWASNGFQLTGSLAIVEGSKKLS